MPLVPTRRHYLAIFTLSFSILVLEIAVSRVLSVTLYSHYAFVAISLAMFGLAASGLVVYLFPRHYSAARVESQLIGYATCFAVSAPLSVLLYLNLPVRKLTAGGLGLVELSTRGFMTLSLIYLIFAVPFFFGGVGVSLLMTHFSRQIARLYCADLAGAGLGCIGAVLVMTFVPASLVPAVVGASAGVAALVFALAAGRQRATSASAFVVVAAILLAAFTTPLFRMRYIKIRPEGYSTYETWNAFSRVSARPLEAPRNARQILPLPSAPETYTTGPGAMIVDIDGAADTPMMQFDGGLSTIAFLRESVLYAAHRLRPGADVLIVGTGGGRDILAALAFAQPSVLGIEINPLMRHVVEDRFGDYSGRPYSRPGVDVVLDEGRSRLARLDRTFDLIQLSLIDTFALNAAGSYVFSENYLYTTEAFREYFAHLTPGGILTLSRYYTSTYPVEVERLAGMVRAAWAAEGVARPAEHVIVLQQVWNATVLAKRTPFTVEELAAVRHFAAELGMTVLYPPLDPARDDTRITGMLTAADFRAYLDRQPLFLDPPTDDRPFFFSFLRRRFAEVPVDPYRFFVHWNNALLLMYLLIATVTAFAALFLLAPLGIFGRRALRGARPGAALPMLFYFGCLGYGFMMLEIPMLQQLMLPLGYPVYALAVVLSSLLLFSGAGSLLSARLAGRVERTLPLVLVGVLSLGMLYAWLLPHAAERLLPASLSVRVLATVALLGPIGLLLGMPYPLGISLLRAADEGLVPWAWGLNGALGVVASVLAVFLGSRIGFHATFLTGVAAYGGGLLAIGLARAVLANASTDGAAPERTVA